MRRPLHSTAPHSCPDPLVMPWASPAMPSPHTLCSFLTDAAQRMVVPAEEHWGVGSGQRPSADPLLLFIPSLSLACPFLTSNKRPSAASPFFCIYLSLHTFSNVHLSLGFSSQCLYLHLVSLSYQIDLLSCIIALLYVISIHIRYILILCAISPPCILSGLFTCKYVFSSLGKRLVSCNFKGGDSWNKLSSVNLCWMSARLYTLSFWFFSMSALK